jgi:tRNA threonylcarbamoyladenosine modification (KEOPS) complex  Pcc1 subunit
MNGNEASGIKYYLDGARIAIEIRAETFTH